MKRHCCEMMTSNANYCDQRPDPYDCPDSLIAYNGRFDEYGLIVHDGGHSRVRIEYCPWCGAYLPSKFASWLYRLERLGFDDPFQQDIPAEYGTGAWYAKSDAEGTQA